MRVCVFCNAGGSLQANDFPELGGSNKAARQRALRQQSQMRGTMAQRLGPASRGVPAPAPHHTPPATDIAQCVDLIGSCCLFRTKANLDAQRQGGAQTGSNPQHD